MPELDGPPVETPEEEGEPSQAKLTPMQWPPEGYVPGKYAPWLCGAQENGEEEIYGPDELGEYVSAIEEMTENVNRCDAAARIWEVLQAWEQRLFRRNYHFLIAGWKGWGMFGGSSGTTGASIMQTQNSMKLFSCNVFGAREKKITALLSREVPGMGISPVNESDSIDQAAQEEAEKYLKVFNAQSCLHAQIKQAGSYFYTDGRVGFLTYTVADQSRWGEEAPDRQEETYGMAGSEGVTPETEMEPSENGEDQPARREVVEVFGKLETKVPLMCDHEHEMGWMRFQKEKSVNLLRKKYPWVSKKIATQGNVGGMDQIDRMARINVRLAVQASSSSGEAYKNDATETVTFFRPSEYEGIGDEEVREVFYETFPDGLEVWHAGGQLAFVRNCRFTQHGKIVHASAGDGQNRESIGTNYLPLQKVLNANISLLDRYFRAAVPRRFAMEPYIDTQLLNTQANDPSKVTAVTGLEGRNLTIDQITGLEKTPQPNTAMFEFIQWLIQGAPDAMDGGTPAVFGIDITNNERKTFGEARLNRDQALQVFSMPWSSICEAVECISLQAVQSAARNRVSNINASLPGQQKLKIEIDKLQGSVLIQRVSDEIPATEAEIQEMVSDLIENSGNNPIYSGIVNNPANLPVFAQMALPQKAGLDIEGAQHAEQQQGEFEILMRSGPQPNPQLQQIQQALAQIPQPPTPETQQMAQQMQQMMQSMPPMVSTVPVAQNNSENHLIHAAITLKFITSANGRKLKNGNEQQKAIWQNFNLHWQEHMAMMEKLKPPPVVDMKANVSIDPTKLPPAAQSKAFQALGLEVSPQELTPIEQEHEQTIEQEGVNAQGIPTKHKISVVGKPLQ